MIFLQSGIYRHYEISRCLQYGLAETASDSDVWNANQMWPINGKHNHEFQPMTDKYLLRVLCVRIFLLENQNN